MATEKQIHWVGKFAQSLLGLGMIIVVIRMIDGPFQRPIIVIAPALRVLVLLAFVAVAASFSTWRYYRKKSRRSAVR